MERTQTTSPQAMARCRLAPAELVAILAFWTVLAIITAAGRRLDPRIPNLPQAVSSAIISLSLIEYALWGMLTVPIVWLSSRYSLESGRAPVRLIGFAVAGVALAMIVDASLAFFRGELLPAGRAERPVWQFSRLGFLDDFMVYLAILGAGISRDYFLRYRGRLEETVQLQAQAAQLQAQLAQAELTVLRSQINPHFLFNTLNAVSALVERDPRGVRRMISRLGELLRATFDGTHEPETPLEKEIEMLRRYVELMEIRFQGRLEVVLRVVGDIGAALVPSLILQPIVENAIKHGVDESSDASKIEIRANRDGDSLVLTVTDSGPGPGQAASNGTGVGLKNTRARLAQLYGSRQSFGLTSGRGGGSVAEIRIPYHTSALPVATGSHEA